MSEVVFEEEKQFVRKKPPARPSSSLEKFLLKSGLVKSRKSAQMLFLVLALLGFITTFVVWGMSSVNSQSYGNYEEFTKNNPELVQ